VTVGLVPTTWKEKNPPGGAAEVLIVSVLLVVPPGGGWTGVGAKLQAAPAGRPAQVRSTGSWKPFCETTVHVLAALPPWMTFRAEGEQLRMKFGTSTLRPTVPLRTRAPAVPTTWTVAVPPRVLVRLPTAIL